MAVTKVINIEVNDDKAVQDINSLNDKLEQTTRETSDVNKGFSDMGSTIDTVSGGAVSKFNNLKTTLGGVTKSFKSVGLAIAATGLGLLIGTIVAVKKAFTSSEEGQNSWIAVMEGVGIVTGKISDAISWLGKQVIKAFKEIGNAISKARPAIEKIFDIVTFGAANSKRSIDALSDSYDRLAKKARERAKDIADADKLERDLIVKRAEADRERADLLSKAEDRQKFSQKERIELLKRAGEIEEEITNKEIKLAKSRLKTKQQQNADSNSTKEDLTEEAQLRANLIQLETDKLNKGKEVTSKISGLIESESAERKAAYQERLQAQRDAANESIKIEQERIKNLQDLENEALSTIEGAESEYYDSLLTKRQKDEQDVRDYYFNLIEQAKQYGLDTSILEQAQADKLQAIRDAEDAKQLERLNAQNNLLKETTLRDEELEIYNLQESYNRKFDLAKGNAELEAALEEEKQSKIQAIQDKYDQIEIDKERAKEEQKKQIMVGSLQTIANIATLFAGDDERRQRQAFKVQKAVNIAQATMDTYKGANAAFASGAAINPIVGAVAAAGAITAGLLNVRNIAKQKFNASSAGSGGSSVASFSSASQAVTSPNFNVVGDTGVNQSSDLQTPIKAYVVGGEVTTEQSLERNKIATAKY